LHPFQHLSWNNQFAKRPRELFFEFLFPHRRRLTFGKRYGQTLDIMKVLQCTRAAFKAKSRTNLWD